MALDIFQKIMENKSIENKLEAWLMLIGSDEPERIAELLEIYPEFQNIYREVYEMCRNVEDIMGLFSKELREMDRNTVTYMIEELEAEVQAERVKAEEERLKAEAEKDKAEVEKKKAEVAEKVAREEKEKRKVAEETKEQLMAELNLLKQKMKKLEELR